jgi:hypothetical protein
VLRLIGRSLTCASLWLVGASGLGCGSDREGSPLGSAGAGGSAAGSGSAGAGAGGMLGVAGAMGNPGGSGPGGAGPGASAQVRFVLKEVH